MNTPAGARIALVNAPPGYAGQLGALPEGAAIVAKAGPEAGVIHVFARTRDELGDRLSALAPALREATVVWVGYPKVASGAGGDLSREAVWAVALTAGLRPVAQVAIDPTWSALRFKVDPGATASTVPRRRGSAPRPALVVPPDLAAALAEDPALRAYFDGLAYTHRKEYIVWILSAKRAETRVGRVVKAVMMLREKRTPKG
jgi:hypothetical protein